MNFLSPQWVVTGGGESRLHIDHLRDLRVSGLRDQTITSAGLYSLAPRFIEHFFRGFAPREIQTALCFPYAGGTFARIKLFPPLGKMKYSQPPGTSARLYLPFPIKTGPLYVCEGEKKTLAAHQVGLNAVGIGGVWNWLSRGEAIDDLRLVNWEGRDVTIVPDSDVFRRPDLLRAIYALGRELQSLGGRINIAQIPQAGPSKAGLDDFLIAGGDVDGLEVFTLSHSIFKAARWWHGRWRLRSVLEKAA